MNELYEAYDKAQTIAKLPFDIDGITDALMADPMNLDLNNIVHTPVAVIVNLPREEYMKRKIGNFIVRKFEAFTICKDDMLIFRASEDEE